MDIVFSSLITFRIFIWLEWIIGLKKTGDMYQWINFGLAKITMYRSDILTIE